MAELLRPEICVIGAGAGGLSAAAAAAAFGFPAVLVEKGRMGGEALQSGSIPVQALIAAAARADMLRNGASLGLRAVRFGVDFAAVNAYVRGVIDAVAANSSRERFTGLGVRVIAGAARFTNPSTVVAGDVTIKARWFVVATGSSPVAPAIPGLNHTPHLNSEDVFELAECPRHLVVIGAGSSGLELAQAFRRLGAEVTVLDRSAPLPGEDRECARVVLDALIREGIKLRTGVEIVKVGRFLAKVHVELATPQGSEIIDGSHLLVTAGRRPNVEDLNLDAAGIKYGAGGIAVDKRMRTSNKRVYAIGDVTGSAGFVHVAGYQAGLVIRNALLRVPVDAHDRVLPRVIHTEPALAHVGLVEEQARARRRAIRVLRWPYWENDRAQAARMTDGHIKIVTDRNGGILGATIVGAQAAENITAWTLAISQKLDIRAFAGLVVPYPTYAEVGKRAAITYFTRSLTSPWSRRIIGWLRRRR